MNSRYEYMTREVPTSPATLGSAFDAEENAQGWKRVWADVTAEGSFIVYRRERKRS